jgi:hypothetical protein
MQQQKNERDLAEIMRDEATLRDRIVSLIQEKPMTVPEISEALGSPRHETMLWLMSLWKYGHLDETEIPDEEGYYRYQIRQ